jgi:GH43 family beta-xylosidase
MSDPYSITGEHVLLTTPTLCWEKQGGMAFNEGPVTLHRNGRIFLIYSASTTWSEDYALGMLTMNEEDDPMLASSWAKSLQPVFRKSIENNVYATGHNSFTTSPDGLEDWIVYHALPAPGADTGLRAKRIQKFEWNGDGTPDFGVPFSDDHVLQIPSGE